MMRRVIGTSLKFPRAIMLAAAGLLVFGTLQLRDAKVDALPEFSPPTVEVQTEALGLSAEEVEQFITVPLEQDLLAGVAWLDTIHSRSVPGLSSIELVFNRGTDLFRARQVVQERISQSAGLPNVSRPPQMLQPQSSLARAAMVSLSSKTLSPIRIGVLARWTIRPRLLAVPGVASVAIWGQRERELQVRVDPRKLASAGEDAHLRHRPLCLRRTHGLDDAYFPKLALRKLECEDSGRLEVAQHGYPEDVLQHLVESALIANQQVT